MLHFKFGGTFLTTLSLILIASNSLECNFERYISQFNKNYVSHSA